jgi:hypothetical protein
MKLHGTIAAQETWLGRSRIWLFLMERKLSRILTKQRRAFVRDLRNIPRYILRVLSVLLVLCGMVELWTCLGDGKLPSMSPLVGIDPYPISSADCTAEGISAERRWNGLAPALDILDRINPVVARWVREKHKNNLLVFCDEYRLKDEMTPALAKYDVFSGRLVINRPLFCEGNGMIAVILCHEYRHSRQNLGKYGQYILSFLFSREGDSSLVENDAMIYEQEAFVAIFGDGMSSEKKLAAWKNWAHQRSQAKN